MENRREFLKKAGLAGGLGAAGALTLKKEYVKPIVKLLEPSAAYAQTVNLNVIGAGWTQPVMDGTTFVPPAWTNVLTLVVDIPGGSPPIPGSTFNAFMSLSVVAEPGGWGTFVGLVGPGARAESNFMDNIGASNPGGDVSFSCNFFPVAPIGYPASACTVNGADVLPLPTVGPSSALLTDGLLALGGTIGPGGVPGDQAVICLQVSADQGVSVNGTPYPPQELGGYCFTALWS